MAVGLFAVVAVAVVAVAADDVASDSNQTKLGYANILLSLATSPSFRADVTSRAPNQPPTDQR